MRGQQEDSNCEVEPGMTDIFKDRVGKLSKVRKMKSKGQRKAPEIVLREGKPSAVILDIDEYREMLERLEDADDLKALEDMRKKPMKFRKLEDFLREYHRGV